jgi:hypothetical protein
VTSNRGILRILCVAALAAAVGCSPSTPSPSPSQDGEPGSKSGAMPVSNKDLPKGAKLGPGKAVIQ